MVGLTNGLEPLLNNVGGHEKVMASDETILTIQDVAELLRVPFSWVYDRLRGNVRYWLPGYKLGKYWGFRRLEVPLRGSMPGRYDDACRKSWAGWKRRSNETAFSVRLYLSTRQAAQSVGRPLARTTNYEIRLHRHRATA